MKRTRLNLAMAALAMAVVTGGSGEAGAASKRAPPPNTAAPATSTPAPGMPGGPATAGPATVPTIEAADRSFVTTAVSSGLLEVEASRLAVERSEHPQLRAFAQRMVDEHSKANDELRELANEAGLTDVPVATMGKYNAMLEKLRALKGADFEHEYAAQMGVAAHTESVALFEQAAKGATNLQLKEFAARLLPQLRDHLRQAQAVAKAVGVPADRLKAANAPPDLTSGSPLGVTDTTRSGGGAGK